MENGGWEHVNKKNKNKTKNKKKKVVNEEEANVKSLIETDNLFQVFLDEEIRKAEKQAKKKLDNSKKIEKQVQKDKAKTKSNQLKKPNQIDNSNQKPTLKLSYDCLIRSITSEKLNSLLKITKTSFPSDPLIWLKDIASYLNVQFTSEPSDPLFTNKSPYYPFCLFEKETQNFFFNLFDECNLATLQLFQDYCIQSIVNNMNRFNQPSLGFRLLIQALAQKYPQLVLLNNKRFIELRNSYQNRNNICSIILWSAAQSGYYDINVGLKVWLSLMLPIVGIKAYSRQVVDTFENLIHSYQFSIKSDAIVDVRNFFPILDFVYTSSGLPTKIQKQIESNFIKLQTLAYGSKPEKVVKNFFPSYLCRLTSSSNSFKNEILQNLKFCAIKDENCFNAWRHMYLKNINQSKIFLQYIDEDWESFGKHLEKKLFKDTLNSFLLDNQTLLASNRFQEVKECEFYTQKILKRINVPLISWSKILFILTLSIAIFIGVDICTHSTFKTSQTYRALESSSLLNLIEQAWQQSSTQIPVYWRSALKHIDPYLEILWDKTFVAWNFALKLLNPVKDWINQNIPQHLEKIDQEYYPKFCSFVKIYFNHSAKFVKVVAYQVTETALKFHDWFETSAFKNSFLFQNNVTLIDYFNFTYYFNQIYNRFNLIFK